MERALTIGVDFDGTLCTGSWPEIGEPNYDLITKLKELKKNGTRLILWTCRMKEQLEEAVQWCSEQGLLFDAINDNLPEVKELFGGNSRKICCDYYIDDKSCSQDQLHNLIQYSLYKSNRLSHNVN